MPNINDEIRALETKLDEAVAAFALYEEELNRELKLVPPEGRHDIFARRAAYEQTLGIEELLARIDALKGRACGFTAT
jgi:hypothetical protein